MKTTKLKFFAIVLAVFLLAVGVTSCGASSDNGSKNADGIFTTFNTEPEKGLIPFNTIETGGGDIVQYLYSGLTYIDEEDKVKNDLAESIESSDEKTWTVKIKSGLKFSDGSSLTAKDFVNNWNFAANNKNAMGNADFFSVIKGYDELNAKNSKVTTLSGLKLVNDTTFTVELNQKQSDFKAMVSYSAFAVVPSAAVKSADTIKEYGEHPVTSGPYMPASGDAWEHNIQFQAVKNPNYGGDRPVKNGGITYKFYTKDTAAYADVQSDQLDVINTIPSADLKAFKSDLGDNAFSKPTALVSMINIGEYVEHFEPGEEGDLRRQAISEAIDRVSIVNQILNGLATTISDFIAPTVAGHNDNLPNAANAQFNAEDAKAKWAKAEAISKYKGTFYIYYNADVSQNQALYEAVANSIKANLNIDAEAKPVATFAQFVSMRMEKNLDGAYRSGWQADYPSAYNSIQPVFGTTGSSNDAAYANSEFDAACNEILSASSDDEIQATADKAQDILLRDLPGIPLWSNNTNGGHSSKVSNVKPGWNGVIQYNLVEVNG